MTEAGASYADALGEAQSLGYAERDPTADVEGYDAAAKAAIIASIAFGVRVVAGDVYHEGIADITTADIDYAAKMGYVVKLLAIAEQHGRRRRGRAGPPGHGARRPPAGLDARQLQRLFVEGEAVGDLMFYGRGPAAAPRPARCWAT